MKKTALFLFALLGPAILTLHNLKAGSAVATDGLGHNTYTCGHPEELAKQRALDLARRKVVMSELSRLPTLQATARSLLRATQAVTVRLLEWHWADARRPRPTLSRLNSALKRVAQIRKSDGDSGGNAPQTRSALGRSHHRTDPLPW